MTAIGNEFNFLIVSEQFPRIAKGIEIRWGTADLEPYINDLIYDTRDHTRQGFPKDVFAALQALLLLHHKLFPGKRIVSRDPWDSTFGDLEFDK